jgi:hypothetical protein
MAVNPITSESLTLDFKSLMKVPVGDRVKAASFTSLGQDLLNALTPIQLALAFPSYYRRALPDISNFIMANRYLDSGGRFNQTGGGAQGGSYPYYDGPDGVNPNARPGGVPEPTVAEMKEKLLKKGIDVDKTYEAMKAGAILENDERVEFMKGMSDDELSKMGLQRIQDENGKTLFQLAPSQYESMTETQILDQYKKDFPPVSFSPKERATLDFIAKREGAKDPNTIFGGDRYVKRLGLDEKPLTERSVSEVINDIMPRLREMSKADGYGVTNDGRVVGTSAVGTGQMIEGTLKANLISMGIPESEWGNVKFSKELQEKLTLENFKTSGIGDPNADPSTWNMGALGQQYESLNVGRGHAPMTEQEKSEISSKSSERPKTQDENISAQDALARLQQAENEKYYNALVKAAYNKPSMTSSDFGPSAVVERQQDVAGIRKDPITPELKEVLQFAGEESGVEVEVFSGGQADITQGGPRTGSERHDLGHAADIRLKVKDADGNYRYLSSKNEQDREIMANFIKNSRRMGAKGIGHGLDYMGESAIHVGTVQRSDIDYSSKEYGVPAGSEAVWESPEWVRNAFYEGQKASAEFDMAAYREARKERLETQTAAAPTTPTPQMVLGGNMYGLNEDMTIVETATGNPIAQVNSGENLIKQGNSIEVTPETKVIAEQLSDNTSADTTGIEEPDTQSTEAAINKPAVMPKTEINPEPMWRESLASTAYDPSPSYQRAINKAKYQNTEREKQSWSRAKIS